MAKAREVAARISTLTLLLCLSGCHQRLEEKNKLGAFEYTTVTLVDQLRWEGGTTRSGGATLCSMYLCVEGRDGIELHKVPEMEPELLLAGVDGKMRFLDPQSGRELRCANCRELNEIFIDRRILALRIPPSTDQWQVYVITASWTRSIRWARLEVANGIISLASDFESMLGGDHSISPKSVSVSPSADAVAWLNCRETCKLNVATVNGRTVESFETGCPATSTLAIRWRGESPEVVHTWEASRIPKHYLCVDEFGAARFRVEAFPVWSPNYEAWAARAQAGEFDHEPLPVIGREITDEPRNSQERR